LYNALYRKKSGGFSPQCRKEEKVLWQAGEREEAAIQKPKPRKFKGQRKSVVVSVNLTEPQKITLEEKIRDWGLDMAAVGRRLIRHLLNNKTILLSLLQKYQAEVANRGIGAGSESCPSTNRPSEPRGCKICIRLTPEEKQKLSLLAYEWFYLPGELARILFELFIMGIIEKNDIWE
jgi:hypothetical protein